MAFQVPHEPCATGNGYLQQRLAENGISNAETRFINPTSFVKNHIASDSFGNIELYYMNLDGYPLTAKKKYSIDSKFTYDVDYVKRTRYAHPLPNAPKYRTQKGMPAKLPYLNGLLTYFTQWNDIETLVIAEGEFKELRACKAGIATVGIAGIFNFATTHDLLFRTKKQCEKLGKRFVPICATLADLWHELFKELPNLKNIIFLHDADALEGSYKRKKDFFTSIKTFHLALKDKPYNLFYGHGITDDFKGIDDLLNSKGVSDAEVKESILSLKDSEFFKVFPINNGADKQRILKHFFPNYKHPIKCEELTINVYEYLSECSAFVSNVFSTHKRVLVDAPTGIGKTDYSFKYARTNGKRMLYAVPYRSQVDQIAEDYQAYPVKGGLEGFDKVAEIETAKSQPIVVCTFDKLAELIEGFDYKNDLLVIDESHNLVNQDFRQFTACEPTFQAAMAFHNCIIISGTPNPFFECLPNGFKRLRVNRALKKNVSIYPTFLNTRKEQLQYVLDQITENKGEALQAVKLNNKDQIDTLEKILLKNGFKAHQIAKVYNRDSLESDPSYLSIINNGALPEAVKVLLTTSKINDGINIENDIKHIYLIDENCPDSIIQFIGRYRKAKALHVHFVCKEKTTGSGQNYNDIFGGLVGFTMAMQKQFEATKEAENIAFNVGLDLKANIDRPHQKTLFTNGTIDWLGLLIEAKKQRDNGLTTGQLLNLISEYGVTICDPINLKNEPTNQLKGLITAQKEGKEEAKKKAVEFLKENLHDLIGAVMYRARKGSELKRKCGYFLGSTHDTFSAKQFEAENRAFLLEHERVVHQLVKAFLTIAQFFPNGCPLRISDYLTSNNPAKLIRQVENAFLIHHYLSNPRKLNIAQRKDARLMINDIEEAEAMNGATLKQLTERLNGNRKYAYLRRSGMQYADRMRGLFLEVETRKDSKGNLVIQCKKPIKYLLLEGLFSARKSQAEILPQVIDNQEVPF